MTPNGVYAILLQELPLPGWLENIIREPLGSLDWRLTFEQRDDYTGSYHFWLLDNLAGRTALLHISADVLEKAFGRIGDLAGRMSSLRAADQLFVFCDAPPVPPDKMAEKDNWFPQGKVMFCLAPQIDRLRSTVDPGERKSLLRNWLDVPPAPSPTAPASAVDRVILDDATREMVVAVLARASEKQIADIRQYFALLLDRSGLQGAWVEDARMKFVVSADTDARILVDMAAGEGSRGGRLYGAGASPQNSLALHAGTARKSTLVAILLLDGLITSGTAEQELRTKYAVPTWGGPVAPPQDIGPDIVWFGPPDIEFQSYEQRAPLLRLDDLPKCLEQGGSVCLITVGNTKATGTGFLIASRFGSNQLPCAPARLEESRKRSRRRRRVRMPGASPFVSASFGVTQMKPRKGWSSNPQSRIPGACQSCAQTGLCPATYGKACHWNQGLAAGQLCRQLPGRSKRAAHRSASARRGDERRFQCERRHRDGS